MDMNTNATMDQAKAHPLDRCTGGELEHAVDILKKSGNLSDQAFFFLVVLLMSQTKVLYLTLSEGTLSKE
jgi:Cu2+-containing amine oxidase